MIEKKDEVVKQTLTKKESVSKHKSFSQASVCRLCVSVRERSSNKIEKDMNKSETGMTASTLKQDPNTYKIQKNMIY